MALYYNPVNILFMKASRIKLLPVSVLVYKSLPIIPPHHPTSHSRTVCLDLDGDLRMILLIAWFPQLPEGWAATAARWFVCYCWRGGAIGFRTHSHDREQMPAGARATTVTHIVVSPVTPVGAMGNEAACGNNNAHHCCTIMLSTCQPIQ